MSRDAGDTRKERGERLRRERIEQAARIAYERAEEAERKAYERAEEAERKAYERADRSVERKLGPIWSRPEPGARRPRFTREQIAEAALTIADRDGFDAVSMRNVAKELGAGTMTLYHYVSTKDDLLLLMNDAIMGEVLIPADRLPADWRGALTAIAHSTRDVFVRHPWAMEALKGVGGGPNAMRHFEQSLAAVSDLDVDISRRLDLILTIDDFVFGFANRHSEADFTDSGELTPEHQAEFRTAMGYMTEQIATGEYPHIAALMNDDEDPWDSWRRLAGDAFGESRFDRGLKRVLDGFALELQAQGDK